jgi:F-type H+-transporting ATPase subunit delta
MHESRVARPYAKSLLLLAQEKGRLDEVKKDMDLFVQVCEENNNFVHVMKNPIIPHDKKKNILDTLFKGRVSDLTMSMFNILTRKNREAFLFDIAKAFTEQYNVVSGIEIAEVTTTFPLTEDQKNDFMKIVSQRDGKKVKLKTNIDEEIIGGYILKVGDRQVDESIKTKLQRLKSEFKENPYISKL